MTTFEDIEKYFEKKDYRLIIAADAEPFVHQKKKNGEMEISIAAGGVATAFGPLSRASHALFVARAKTLEDRETADKKGYIKDPSGNYTLKRLFLTPEQLSDYYYGFANQALWPLCHIIFERPLFSWSWYEGFKTVNEKFARAIKEEIKGKTFVWINDYQLCLVPKYLGPQKNTTIGFFWHIPWPTWERFRTLPQKKEILESMLQCDFIGFHRGYQARNFLNCVERELEARIDLEKNRVYYNKHITTVGNLPMGVDTDNVASLAQIHSSHPLKSLVNKFLPSPKNPNALEALFAKQKVMLGVDRLDYTKGLPLRLDAIDQFFAKYPQYKGKVTYVSILASSREAIPAYKALKKEFMEKAAEINKKYGKKSWQPIKVVNKIFSREEITHFYTHAAVCLVTPLDDGMNLVSKEFVIAASLAKNPGMLVLSQFAGSAIDLTDAIIINPYDTMEVAKAIKLAFDMPEKEKKRRISAMSEVLHERNIYEWALSFLKEAVSASKDNK